MRAGEADPAGPWGHSKDFTVSERNGHWGFSVEGWHSVTSTVKKNTLMDHQLAVEVEGEEAI